VRAIELPSPLVEAMGRHARASYPEECCGFLIGALDPPEPTGRRRLLEVEPAANEFDGERSRRFMIRPRDLLEAERRREGTDRMVAGFYHSHPDHPARPSAFDQEHALPWYTYIVLSVTAQEVPTLGAFELDEATRIFHEVPVVPPAALDRG